MENVEKREALVCVCAECNRVIRTIGVLSVDATPLLSHGICPECAERLYGDIFRRARRTAE